MNTFRGSHRFPVWAVLLTSLNILEVSAADSKLHLNLRSRVKTSISSAAAYKIEERSAAWDASNTALIICDMWDDHWCKSAARRVAELAGPMNDVVKQARAKGVFIIHAPSTTVKFYADTPQRKHALNAPFVKASAPLSTSERWGTAWCWPDSQRERDLPIDDSDMGCDCPVKCTIRDAWSRQFSTIKIAA